MTPEDQSFTKRELQCINRFLEGMTTKEIAKTLEISTRTVESHLVNIKLKSNCKNRTKLIIYLYRYVTDGIQRT